MLVHVETGQMSIVATGLCPVSILYICPVSAADSFSVARTDICLVPKADIFPVASKDICLVSTHIVDVSEVSIVALSQRPSRR